MEDTLSRNRPDDKLMYYQCVMCRYLCVIFCNKENIDSWLSPVSAAPSYINPSIHCQSHCPFKWASGGFVLLSILGLCGMTIIPIVQLLYTRHWGRIRSYLYKSKSMTLEQKVSTKCVGLFRKTSLLLCVPLNYGITGSRRRRAN